MTKGNVSRPGMNRPDRRRQNRDGNTPIVPDSLSKYNIRESTPAQHVKIANLKAVIGDDRFYALKTACGIKTAGVGIMAMNIREASLFISVAMHILGGNYVDDDRD
jgi:hypothetical protein